MSLFVEAKCLPNKICTAILFPVKEFNNVIVDELFRLFGTRHKISNSYHP